MKRALLIGLTLVMSCSSGAKGDDDGDQEQNQPAAEPTGLGSLGLMGSLLSSKLDEPGPYAEPRQSPNYRDGERHLAVMELSGSITELPSFSLLEGSSGTALRRVTERLRELTGDDEVSGLILRVGELSIDLALAEELRSALAAFRGAGKSLHCHSESASNVTYLLLAQCETIGLAPTGTVMITGVSAMPIHVKGLLERLDVTADFLSVGAYKGAAEPLTRDAPSREMDETLDAILDEAFATMVEGIATGRKLDEASVRAAINQAVYHDQAAVDARLVDEIATFEAFRDARGPWKKVSIERKPVASMSGLMEMVGLTPRSRPRQPHVALVYAVGDVVDGNGDGLLGAREEIASRTLATALRRLAADDAVKAVVLRVSSPGGSALASELIWHAVADLGQRKPVVVSMGGVAASGGYYISCGASRIYADRNTLTGSIGVVGGKLAVNDALAGIGVKSYPRGRGKRALMMASLDAWSADERSAIQTMMEQTYDAFVSRVADGRELAVDQVRPLAQGRVWTGAAAVDKGLVDEVGGLEVALARARELGGVDAASELEIYPPEPTLMDYLQSYSGGVRAPLGSATAVAEIRRALGPRAAAVVDQLLGQLTGFAAAPIQTALLFPVVLQ
jgi:protease-4